MKEIWGIVLESYLSIKVCITQVYAFVLHRYMVYLTIHRYC